MTWVYHLCTPDFRGTTLFPLEHLRDVYPDLHQRERRKYDDREAVLQFNVPWLDATWGETVNLSALDPHLLVAERRRLGVPFSNLLKRRLLRIPVERIACLPSVRFDSETHWINSRPGDAGVPRAPLRREFARFDAATHIEPTSVPELHRRYLLEQLARGEQALGFVFIPHILVAGPIDVSGLEAKALEAS